MNELVYMSGCFDCNLPYDCPSFQDLIIPDLVWQQIAPDNGNGLLCPNCLCRRLAEAQIEYSPPLLEAAIAVN